MEQIEIGRGTVVHQNHQAEKRAAALVPDAVDGHPWSGSCRTPNRRSHGRRQGGIGSSVGGSRTFAEDLGCLVTSVKREPTRTMPRCRELDPSDHGRRRRWVSQSAGWVLRVTRIITRLSPRSRTGTHPLKLALARGFRQIGDVTWDPTSGGGLAGPQSRRGSRSENAGDGESSRQCLTAAGASRRTSVALSIDGTELP